VRTSWDGDLRLYTCVDGLPLDGMQEVWGSNPHSSTAGQRHNPNSEPVSNPLLRGNPRGRPSHGQLADLREPVVSRFRHGMALW
jgi:hypothetical protein